MDPLSMVASLGGGLMSLIGGQNANAANARQAAENNLWNWNEQLNAQQFNSNQASLARDFTGSLMDKSMAFNNQQAQQQMAFQDTEMGKAMGYNTSMMQKSMDFNAQQAGVQRDYETQMANTAYQRAVRDMKAAGLNPILSAGTGGANTPSVSSPSVSAASIGVPSGASGSVGVPGSPMASSPMTSATSARMSDVISPAIQTAFQGAQLNEQVRNLQSQRLLNDQRVNESNANTDVAAQTALNTKAQRDNIVATGHLIDAQTNDAAASARQKDALTRNTDADTSNKLAGPPGPIWNPNVIRGNLPLVGGAVESGVSWLGQHDPLSYLVPSMPSTVPPNPGTPAVGVMPYGVMTGPHDKQWGGTSMNPFKFFH